jgi:hypothetical protein
MSRPRTLHHLLSILTLLLSLAHTSLQYSSKYFQEHPLAGHLDLRFATSDLPATAHRPNDTALEDLLHSYVLTMRDLGVATWLAHGTLLGWHWGGQFLPWDLDVDMHVFLGEAQSSGHERGLGMSFLAQYYNMTVHRYRKVEYLLDINPAFADRSEVDGNGVDSNRIDAQWVNM